MINELFPDLPESQVILEVGKPPKVDAFARRARGRMFVGFPEMETRKAAILASFSFH